jgi:nucleolar protein 12
LNEDGTVKRKRGKKERPGKAGKSLVQQEKEKEMGKGKKEGDVKETMQVEEIVLSAKEPVEPVSPDEPITTTITTMTSTTTTPTARTSDQRKNRRIKKKPKYTPPSETPADLDRRTCFIGNVSISVLKSSSLQAQLKSHLLGFVPGAGIESVRFRSIAFSAPTAQKEVTEGAEGGSEESARVQREKERAGRWREEEDEDEGRKRRRLDREREEEGEDKVTKVFFRPGEKRKVAFLKGEVSRSAERERGHSYPRGRTDPIASPTLFDRTVS